MIKTGGIYNKNSTTYKTATEIVSIQITLRGTRKFWEDAEREAYLNDGKGYNITYQIAELFSCDLRQQA